MSLPQGPFAEFVLLLRVCAFASALFVQLRQPVRIGQPATLQRGAKA
jgi:hypothetical protein